MKPTLEQFAKSLGANLDQCHTQLRKNKAQLEWMRKQALATGNKVNGYTADQLDKLIEGIKP